MLQGSSTTANVSYSWTGGGYTAATANPTVTVAGLYTLTVTDNTNGCTAQATAMVVQDTTNTRCNGKWWCNKLYKSYNSINSKLYNVRCYLIKI
ncbi:MAG: hypothetical protein R2798_06860 [Chitinophagales bacterium]